MISLKGKNVIITGAGSGIGREMAKKFAAEGANLAIIDINQKNLEATLEMVKKGGITVRIYICDISNRGAVEKTVSQIIKDFSNIDVLVNNAGVVVGKKFLDLTLDEMQWTMNINFWGHVYFTRLILPRMIARKSGSIVNIASSGGLLGMTKMSDYCASKFAEVGLSESLRRELHMDGHKGITITCVCPYIIDTGMFAGFKALLFSPFVKAETAAKKIVNATKRGKALLIIPYHSIKFMQIIKLTPPWFMDWALRVFGGSNAMDSFVGRKKNG
jgi:all-trans-retinol dehydrogenase (NAD+)